MCFPGQRWILAQKNIFLICASSGQIAVHILSAVTSLSLFENTHIYSYMKHMKSCITEQFDYNTAVVNPTWAFGWANDSLQIITTYMK